MGLCTGQIDVWVHNSYAMKPVPPTQTSNRPVHNPMPEIIDTAAHLSDPLCIVIRLPTESSGIQVMVTIQL